MTDALPLIVGNWKMHGLLAPSVENLTKLAEAALYHRPNCQIVVCPPATLLHPLSPILKNNPVKLGAQDCHFEAQGAFTGDISASMLKDAGVSYVIVGHSERRSLHQETNSLVKQKAASALKEKLSVILCIGESASEREAGKTFEVIEKQLKESLPEAANADNTIIAYEPVWAIGTGVTPTLKEIEEVHQYLHTLLASMGKPGNYRVLYGGSVKAGNAAEIIQLPSVQGLLVGGASITFHDFWDVIISATLREATSFPIHS